MYKFYVITDPDSLQSIVVVTKKGRQFTHITTFYDRTEFIRVPNKKVYNQIKKLGLTFIFKSKSEQEFINKFPEYLL